MKFINEEEYGTVAIQMFLYNILVPIVMGIFVLNFLVFASAPHSHFLYDIFGYDLNDLSYCFQENKNG